MSDTFITNIKVVKVRDVVGLEIPLSVTERQHLILTGRNGCGKTSFLLALNKLLDNLFSSSSNYWEQFNLISPGSGKNLLLLVDDVEINFNHDYDLIKKLKDGTFIFASFDSKRQARIEIPSGIKKVNLRNRYAPSDKINDTFVQYIVNLKAERSFARDDGDEESVRRIDAWFVQFESRLQDLFECENLELVFDRQHFNFFIKIDGKEQFSLAELSDGYSAVISIVTEIMLRMEAAGSHAYDLEGVVLIDEVETHLHVELQKKILPFLCDFFPKIQFIISTHSPFVLSSVANAVICDLEKRIVTQDLSGYSYDALIESYFKSDKYSELLKGKVVRYEALADMPKRSDDEMDEYFELKHELTNLPKYLAPELDIKIKQIASKPFS
jgi:predicted ATP-binding protein involved in virulence